MARKPQPLRPRRTLKIRSGDQVQVISGKDRGKSGRVLRVDPRNERVYVEGLNMVKRHTRPQQVRGAQTQTSRRRDRARGPDPRLQRDAARPQRQQAHPRAASSARTASAPACAVRTGARLD